MYLLSFVCKDTTNSLYSQQFSLFFHYIPIKKLYDSTQDNIR